MHRAQAVYASAQGSDASVIQRFSHLIDRNVRRIVRRLPSESVYDDLWSVGALGLLEAAERFDAQRGVRFESFADHRIRGAMLDELRRMDTLPRRLRDRTDTVAQKRRALTQALGRPCTDDEVAEGLGIPAEELAELDAVAQPTVPMGDSGALELASSEPDAFSQVTQRQSSERVAGAVSQLTERLQLVLSLYYVEELTLKEIARMLEVSEPRVCQLHKEAVTKLKGLLAPLPSSSTL